MDQNDYPFPSKLTKFLSPDPDPDFYTDRKCVEGMATEASVGGFRRVAELLYSGILLAPWCDAHVLALLALGGVWRQHFGF